MANYSLVVNSKFQPFSFERYIQPYQLYGAAYKEQQDALSELTNKASVWENMIDKQADQEVYNQYKAYADDLYNQAENISKYGINTSSRQAMLDMRARYAKEITPIEQAYNKKAADVARQQKLNDATGGKTVFTRTAATTSLGDYMKGVDDFGQANLDQIMQESAAGAKALSARIFSREEDMDAFESDYYALIQKQGVSPEQALKILAGDKRYPEFAKYIEDTKKKYSISNYDEQAQARITSAIMQGINAGMVYQESYTPVNNWRDQEQQRYINQLSLQDDNQQFQKEERKLDRELQREQSALIPIAGTDTYLDPKTGMRVNKKGEILSDFKAEQKHKQNKAVLKDALSKVATVEDAGHLGYEPVGVLQLHHKIGGKRVWTFGRAGDDVPHVTSDLWTDTNLISKNGKFTYNIPMGVTANIVEDINSLPDEEKENLKWQMQQVPNYDKIDWQILQVEKKTPGKFDYILLKEKLKNNTNNN